jgi:hypothetical protein
MTEGVPSAEASDAPSRTSSRSHGASGSGNASSTKDRSRHSSASGRDQAIVTRLGSPSSCERSMDSGLYPARSSSRNRIGSMPARRRRITGHSVGNATVERIRSLLLGASARCPVRVSRCVACTITVCSTDPSGISASCDCSSASAAGPPTLPSASAKARRSADSVQQFQCAISCASTGCEGCGSLPRAITAARATLRWSSSRSSSSGAGSSAAVSQIKRPSTGTSSARLSAGARERTRSSAGIAGRPMRSSATVTACGVAKPCQRRSATASLSRTRGVNDGERIAF